MVTVHRQQLQLCDDDVILLIPILPLSERNKYKSKQDGLSNYDYQIFFTFFLLLPAERVGGGLYNGQYGRAEVVHVHDEAQQLDHLQVLDTLQRLHQLWILPNYDQDESRESQDNDYDDASPKKISLITIHEGNQFIVIVKNITEG